MSQELPPEVQELNEKQQEALVNLIDSRKTTGNEEAPEKGSPA